MDLPNNIYYLKIYLISKVNSTIFIKLVKNIINNIIQYLCPKNIKEPHLLMNDYSIIVWIKSIALIKNKIDIMKINKY